GLSGSRQSRRYRRVADSAVGGSRESATPNRAVVTGIEQRNGDGGDTEEHREPLVERRVRDIGRNDRERDRRADRGAVLADRSLEREHHDQKERREGAEGARRGAPADRAEQRARQPREE